VSGPGSFAGIAFSATYNTRFQPNELEASSSAGTAMDLTYNFLDASSHNNGNVMGITNNRDNTRSQSFTYDSLSRIATAKTSSTSGSNCWGETYTIDQWANLTSIGAVSGYTGCTQESLSVTAGTNNWLSATGFSYDAAGNMLGDSVNTYGWNAESEIKSAGGVNYTYDGDGNRVQKSNGKIYWYGAGAEILDESDASGNITDEYVFFGGKRVAHRVVSSGAISYYAEDFLGSSRAITTSSGTLCYDADFYPFGGERVITNPCAQNYKFTGKERDTETGNDDFGARYYASKLGRWLSADWSSVPTPVPYANLTNPQTLNLYAMVSDNPETFVDLDGHGLASWMWMAMELQQEKQKEEQAGNQQGQNSGTSQDQKPDPKKQPSWDKTKPVPDDPSKLGPDWKKDPNNKNPNGEVYVNVKTGEKMEWNKGRKGPWGPSADRGKDGWHYTAPGGTRGRQTNPGQIIKTVVKVGIWGTIGYGILRIIQTAMAVCAEGGCEAI
jgi:RHS repeat-associated protein